MNTHRASLLFAGLLCAATSAGCRGTTTSDKVETKDIRATIEAVDDGWAGDITVSIDLDVARKDNNNHLSLATGDKLTATTGKKSKTFEESWGADGYYKADVLEESPELTVALRGRAT
ncbi:MAG: hypothetical protein R3F14_38075 [Polyangiaceae bacterium]